MQNNELISVPIVKFKEGSWFGDYQIMLNVRSSWDLQATREPKEKSQVVANIPPGLVQVFSLEKHKFMKIVHRYPSMRRWLRMRANLRRSHFKKVFEENRHIYLLNEKKMLQEKYFNEIGRPLDLSIESEDENHDIFGEILPRKLTKEEKAKKKMWKLLNREFHEFRLRARSKHYNPMDLHNKVDFLTNQYIKIHPSEQDEHQLIGFNKHI